MPVDQPSGSCAAPAAVSIQSAVNAALPYVMRGCRAAAAVRAVFVDFDACFEAGSLDEAYLDVTDYCQQHGLTGRRQHTDLMQTVATGRQNAMRFRKSALSLWKMRSLC